MKIVICEDETMCSDLLNEYIKRWARENGVFVELFVFVSAEQLLFELEDGLDVDLLLLDIRLDKMNGIKLAHRLRELEYRMQIVFTTDSPEYVFEGYNVSALNYLVKPINYNICHSILEQAHKLIVNKRFYLCRTSESLNRILYEDMLYIEMISHTAIIHTRDTRYSTRRTITEIIAELDDTLFVRCHKSFVVNLQHIASISKRCVVLSDKSCVDLGKNFASDINEKFIKYYKDKR